MFDERLEDGPRSISSKILALPEYSVLHSHSPTSTQLHARIALKQPDLQIGTSACQLPMEKNHAGSLVFTTDPHKIRIRNSDSLRDKAFIAKEQRFNPRGFLFLNWTHDSFMCCTPVTELQDSSSPTRVNSIIVMVQCRHKK